MLSVPQICFAELGACFEKQNNPEISCSAMKAISLLNLSKKTFNISFGDEGDFFISSYFENSTGSDIPIICDLAKKGILSASTMVSWSFKNIESDNYSCFSYLKFNDYRLRGSPPGKNDITDIEKVYLLSLEALQRGSLPADDINLNFYNTL